MTARFGAEPPSSTEKHVSGSAKSFAGKEETVLETSRLSYEVPFDVTGGRQLATRR